MLLPGKFTTVLCSQWHTRHVHMFIQTYGLMLLLLYNSAKKNWASNTKCFIHCGYMKMQQWWYCGCGLGCSVYLLLTSFWPAPTYSGDEWNFVCGTHSQGCNLHNRILKILLKFLFSWILCQDCPSTCVPRTCKRCISEIPQRNFLSFPKTIRLALRMHWIKHGAHIAADIPMYRFLFVTYWPSLWHEYIHDMKSIKWSHDDTS